MSNCTYSLDSQNYTWPNALLWGNSIEHFKKAASGTWDQRIVHVLIGLIEFIPLIGQIISIFEMIFMKRDDEPISSKNPSIDASAPPSLTRRFEELHFSWEDIEALSKRCLGLRHVTEITTVLKEVHVGFPDGCSLSLSPQHAELEGLQERKWEQILPSEREKFIQCFEEGLDEFIQRSFWMDYSEDIPPNVYYDCKILADVVTRVSKCCFCIIDYGFDREPGRQYYANFPTDLSLWGRGLGRYPKQRVQAAQISSLPFLKTSDLQYTPHEMGEILMGPNGVISKQVAEHISILVRNNLILAIRKLPALLEETA